MRAYIIGSLVIAGVLLAAGRTTAHHSFAAEFDANKPVTLKGVVTKIDWTNPHVWFYINVKDKDTEFADFVSSVIDDTLATAGGIAIDDDGTFEAEERGADAYVPDLDWCQCHGRPPYSWSSSELTSSRATINTITASIGDRSSGPSGGTMRRKIRRYGSQTSKRNRWTLFNVGEYGSRIQLVMM